MDKGTTTDSSCRTDPPTNSPLLRAWVVAVVLSAFGPYVGGGVRLEQIAIYASVIFVMLSGRLGRKDAFMANLLPFLALWGSLTMLALAGAVTSTSSGHDYNNFLAGVDNLLTPLALMFVTWYWYLVDRNRSLVNDAALAIVLASSMNAVIALASMLSRQFAAQPWLGRFWGSGVGSVSVAVKAAENGRFSGIFNQPAEAGVAYSLALFCLFFLVTKDSKRKRWLWVFSATLLVCGGILTVSKIFLLAGLPLFILALMLFPATRGMIVRLAVTLGISISLLGRIADLGNWGGRGMLQELFAGNDSLLVRLSAGRVGGSQGGSLKLPVEYIVDHNPLFGVGAAGLAVSYDSAWVEAVIIAGASGVFLLGLIFSALWVRLLHLKSGLDPNLRRLASLVVMLSSAASFGIPVLTANRVATLIWVLLGLLILNEPRRVEVLYKQSTVSRAFSRAQNRAQRNVPREGLPAGMGDYRCEAPIGRLTLGPLRFGWHT